MTIIDPTPLPAFGFVTGRFALAVADTAQDDDHLPNFIPAAGTISFRPAVPKIVTTNPSRFISPQTATFTLNSAGVLADHNGLNGVWLVPGVYTVSFKLAGLTVQSFDVTVTGEHTLAAPLDLVLYTPTPVEPTVKWVVNEQVYRDTLDAAERAEAAAATVGGSSDGVVADALTNPSTDTRAALDTVLARKGTRRSILDYGATPTNDTTRADSTAAFQAAFGAGGRIYIPAGLFYISQPITIGTDADVLAHDDAVIKLAPMARCHMFRHDATLSSNGSFRWVGGTIDGNDANQGDYTLGGASYDVSKGLVVSKCTTARVENVTVRRVRGHAINHWNNDVFIARNLRFDQGIDPTATSGGRRRDGVTGSSRIVDIEGVSGFTGDDMVAVLAGAQWGSSGAGGVANVDSVRVRGVSGEVSAENAGVRTWRGVALYTKNGYKIGRADVGDVSGVFTLACVAAVPNNDSAWTSRGSVSVLKIDGVSGRVYNSNEFGAPVYISETTVQQAVVANVYDFQAAGSGLIESPTVRVSSAEVTSLYVSRVKKSAASTVPAVLLSGTAKVATFHADAIETAGAQLEKNSTDAAGTQTRGVPSDKITITAGTVTSLTHSHVLNDLTNASAVGKALMAAADAPAARAILGAGDGTSSVVIGTTAGTAADAGAVATALGGKADTTALASYVPTSRTIAGKALSGNVTLAKADVGLGSVDNTSDASKPVSTATATAIAAKVGSTNATVTNIVYVTTLPGTPVNGTLYLTPKA